MKGGRERASEREREREREGGGVGIAEVGGAKRSGNEPSIQKTLNEDLAS